VHAETALKLLGPLASPALQRRYIVRGGDDGYVLPTELLNDAAYFLRHPQLGGAASLPSVRALARVLEEHAPKVPLNDATVSNETLVERDPHWARIRYAAEAVLREIGADLEEWERKELVGGDA
jgi:hypothetical protein